MRCLSLALVPLLACGLAAADPHGHDHAGHDHGHDHAGHDHGPAPAASATASASLRADASYLVGVQMGEYAKRMRLDPEQLLAGVRDASTGAEPRIAADQAQAILGRYQGEMQAAARAEASTRKDTNKAWLAENATREGVTTTPSGLQYEILASGEGRTPTREDTVEVVYTGRLLDGTVFDATSRHGTPTDSFQVGGVIPGWTEALLMMKEGDRWRLTIPAELAYGEHGPPSIGDNQILVFEVELKKVVGK